MQNKSFGALSGLILLSVLSALFSACSKERVVLSGGGIDAQTPTPTSTDAPVSAEGSREASQPETTPAPVTEPVRCANIAELEAPESTGLRRIGSRSIFAPNHSPEYRLHNIQVHVEGPNQSSASFEYLMPSSEMHEEAEVAAVEPRLICSDWQSEAALRIGGVVPDYVVHIVQPRYSGRVNYRFVLTKNGRLAASSNVALTASDQNSRAGVRLVLTQGDVEGERIRYFGASMRKAIVRTREVRDGVTISTSYTFLRNLRPE